MSKVLKPLHPSGSCKKCQHYQESSATEKLGKCFRFPPMPRSQSSYRKGYAHPFVYENDYCGEFKNEDS